MAKNKNRTLELSLVDILGLLAVFEGLTLLPQRELSAAIALLVGFLLLIFNRVVATKNRTPQARRAAFYAAWVVAQASELFENYGSTPALKTWPPLRCQEPRQNTLIQTLQLDIPELLVIEVIARVAGVDMESILERAVSGGGSPVVQIDGTSFLAKTGLGKVIIAISEDPAFAQLSLKLWLLQSRQWLLDLPAPPLKSVAQ